MKLSVLDEADTEAIEAANWYEQRSAGLGYDFYAEVKKAFIAIEADPLQYPRVEFTRVGDVRRFLLDRFPYLLVYQVLPDKILVLAVSHASRDNSFWKERQES